MTTADDLRLSPLDSLEALYRSAPLGPRPRGLFRGEVLRPVDSLLARSRLGGAVLLPFERLPFGIDFDRDAWFFVHPRLRTGHFRATPGRSRWRDAEVLRLEYDVSRLPGPIRGWLYDEVKPLDDSRCLGLGGVNGAKGDGDLFFFLLEPLRA